MLAAFFALRPAGAGPEVIAALAVLARLFYPMRHRLAALGADFARGFGELPHFPGKLIVGRGHDGAVFRFWR